jgi:DNA-binding transcriptional LysR family regulator
LNFKQLETFYWAARLGSFNAAAERLHATQSTISMRIQELERDLGVALFDRTQRVARVSERGRELMVHAEQVLRLVAGIREAMASEEGTVGFVRVGVAEVISLTWLPRLVKEIHRRFPRVVVELDEALTRDLIERLRSGMLDLILAPGRIPDYGSPSLSLGRVEFAWMASPHLGLPERQLGPRDLQDLPVIILSRESYHHVSIQDWFRAGNATSRRMDTCKSMNVAASLAAEGLGITMLPPRCVESEIRTGRLRVLDSSPPFQPVEFTATVSAENVQPLAERIASLAREISDFEGKP